MWLFPRVLCCCWLLQAIGHVHAGSLHMAMDEKATNMKLSGHWDWAAEAA